jgi:ribosomal protein S18 acetylase RimI-like enzyme
MSPDYLMFSLCPYNDQTDRAGVVRLWQTVFAYDAAHNRPQLAIDKKLAVDDGLFFVAVLDRVVVGTILAGYDGHRGWLYSVAVDPAKRRSGIGAALVRHAERVLLERGCVKINLQIMSGNEAVTGFYEKLGFVVEPRVSMGKRLPQNVPSNLVDC